MRIEALGNGRLADFITYCKAYGDEHDGSFLYENDLKEFKPGAENPTYILLDDADIVIGAVSLILEKQFRELRKGRIRILHSTNVRLEAYRLLTDAIMQAAKDIDSFYLFIPEQKQKSIGTLLEELNFYILRYAWLLRRDDAPIAAPEFIDDMQIRPLRMGQDEQAWCDIINTSFANHIGHTHRTPEMVSKELASESFIEGSMKLLWKDNEPIGLIKIEKEIEEGQEIAFIGPIAILPEYQGRGLGRNLLRTGIIYGKEKGFAFTELTVSAENSKAADLYLSEGFNKVQVMICYNIKLNETK